MQPIISLFAPIGLILFHTAIKRNLITHFQRPSYHFPTINKSVDFILSLSLLAFGFGNLFVNNFTNTSSEDNNGTLNTNWTMVLIACGFIVFLPLRIFYCCFPKPAHPHYDYEDKKMLMLNDYDRMNPSTKEIAIAEYKNYIDSLDTNNNNVSNYCSYVQFHLNN
jgi:hypothetical protein